MKRSQIILLTLFLVLSLLIYIPVLLNTKSYEKKEKKETKIVNVSTQIVTNEMHQNTMHSYGQISPVTELLVSFEVQGRLLIGDKRLKPGTSFRKGDILYKIDFKEFTTTIIARKMALIGVISQSMPDFSLDFPQRKNAWEDFLAALGQQVDLPNLPKLKSQKEQLFWASRNVLSEYYNIRSLEHRAQKYFYAAPFSGTVTEVYSEPGSIVNPGVQIAKIAQTGDFELKVPVALHALDTYASEKEAKFTDPSGKLMATGKIVRISDVINQRTQSADVYYSVKAVEGETIYNGLYLNVAISHQKETPSVILPRTALTRGKVYVLEGTQLKPVEVLQVSEKPDSVFVEGLTDGQKVVLEQIGTISEDITYKSAKQ